MREKGIYTSDGGLYIDVSGTSTYPEKYECRRCTADSDRGLFGNVQKLKNKKINAGISWLLIGLSA